MIDAEAIRNETIEECVRVVRGVADDVLGQGLIAETAQTIIARIRALKDTRVYDIIDDATGEVVGNVEVTKDPPAENSRAFS